MIVRAQRYSLLLILKADRVVGIILLMLWLHSYCDLVTSRIALPLSLVASLLDGSIVFTRHSKFGNIPNFLRLFNDHCLTLLLLWN